CGKSRRSARGPHAPARGRSMVGSDSTQFAVNYFKEFLSLIWSRRGRTFDVRASVRFVLLLKRVDKRSQVDRALATNTVGCRLNPRCEMPEDEPGAHKRDADDDERDAESSHTVTAKNRTLIRL